MKVLAFPRNANASNPYTALLYDEIEKAGVAVEEFDIATCNDVNADIVHVHWPEWFLGRRNPLVVMNNYHRWIEFLRAAKEKGTKVVWTAHNLKAHERRHEWLHKKFWREFLTMLDGCVCLSESSRRMLLQQLGELQPEIAVIPHGHYRDAYPMKTTREQARKKLAIAPDDFVYLHLGLIREYKNVPELISAFSGLGGGNRLVVAGEVFDPRLRKRIETAADGHDVTLKLRRIADDDVQTYFRAADLAVFPYRDILNSGSALLALSFDVPILVPAIGSMPDLRDQVGADWVMTYSGEVTAESLLGARDWITGTQRGSAAPLAQLNWDGIAKSTVELYHRVLDR